MEFGLPSRHELLPNLSVLDRLILERIPEGLRKSSIDRELEQLPYYLRGACSAYKQLEAARDYAVGKALSRPGVNQRSRIILSEDEVDPLSYALDFQLFCLRRFFDALVLYLRRCNGRESNQYSRSFTEFISNPEKGKYHKIDDSLKNIIIQFWTDIGSSISGYRDQASHRAIILSNCVVFKNNDGKIGLRMLLPDDPRESKPSSISYNPGLPAMEFCCQALRKSPLFASEVIEKLIDLTGSKDENARGSGVSIIAMRGAPINLGPSISGETVPFPVTLSNIIENVKNRKNKQN